MAESWTRARLLELVAGRQVSCVDDKAVAMELPPWILESGATAAEVSTGQRLALTHPEDRQALVDAWWRTVNNPGELVEVDVRAKIDGMWVLTRTWAVSLLDEPDFGAVFQAIEFGQTVSEADFEEVVQSGVFEEAHWLIHTLDEAGVILATEGMVEEITGRRAEDIVGQAVIEHIHPDGFDDALNSWMELLSGPPGTTRTALQRVVRPDGTVIWVDSTTIKRVGDDGGTFVTSIVHDATERRQRESALRASQQEFQLLADQVPAAVFRTDADQTITFRNERWRQELDGDTPLQRLVELIHADDREAHTAQLERLATGRSDTIAAYEVRGADGQRVFAVSCRSVLDLVNQTRSYVGSVTDITATVKLRQRAERDALTGLWNRQATAERLDAALAEDAASTAVVFIDLDGFKGVNDTWGHHAGDHVLRELAGRLHTSLRPDDVVGRFGGDEFVIVIPRTSPEIDEAVLRRLDEALEEPIVWPGGSWPPKASIGIAHGRPGEDAAALVSRADHEMFTDKRQRKALS